MHDKKFNSSQQYNSSLRYKFSDRWIIRHDPEFHMPYSIYDIANNQRYKINCSSFVILKMLQENYLTVESLIRNLVQYNVKMDSFMITSFIDKMINDGAIVTTEEFGPNKKILYNEITINSNVPVTSGPYAVEVHLTNGCNLRCKHCAYDAGIKLKDELAPEEWCAVFDQLENLLVNHLIISGGEPLLYSSAKNLLRYLISKKMRIELFTNATLLDDETAHILSHWNFSTSVSLDGADSETHNLLRGCKCFDQTIKGLQLLSKYKGKFAISTTVHKKNMHQLYQLADLAANVGAQNIGFILIDPFGRAKNQHGLILDKSDQERIRNVVETIKTRNDISISFLDIANVEFKDWAKPKELFSKIYCSGGTSRMAIRSDGNVFPCVYAFANDKFLVGSVKEKTVKELWVSPNWHLFRGAINLEQLSTCKDCDWKNNCDMKNCRLRAYCNHGDFYGKPPNCHKDYHYSVTQEGLPALQMHMS